MGLRRVTSSYVSKADAREFCTDVVNDLVTVALSSLSQEGVVNDMIAEFVQDQREITCTNKKRQSGQDGSLDFTHMLGVFGIHAAIALICLSVSCTTGSSLRRHRLVGNA